MIADNAVERYRFTCVRCGHRWEDDYDVREILDLDGDLLSFYRFEGQACEAPVSAETMCPACRCGPVNVVRLTSRAVLTPEVPGA